MAGVLHIQQRKIMKSTNPFSREDVIRANEAMRRNKEQGGKVAGAQLVRTVGSSVRLSSTEINQAFAKARKALAAA